MVRYLSVIQQSLLYNNNIGECITTVSLADTCGLNSTSLECMANEFRASSCICQPDVIDSRCQFKGGLYYVILQSM